MYTEDLAMIEPQHEKIYGDTKFHLQFKDIIQKGQLLGGTEAIIGRSSKKIQVIHLAKDGNILWYPIML